AFRARSAVPGATFGRVSSPSRPVTNLDKSDVLGGLFAVWDEIDTVLAGLTEAQWQAQTPLPGWTVHDVTAHLIGTESMLQAAAGLAAACGAAARGRKVRGEEGGAKRSRRRKSRVYYKVQRPLTARLTVATGTSALSSNPNVVARPKIERIFG